jgi:hypothetical protein
MISQLGSPRRAAIEAEMSELVSTALAAPPEVAEASSAEERADAEHAGKAVKSGAASALASDNGAPTSRPRLVTEGQSLVPRKGAGGQAVLDPLDTASVEGQSVCAVEAAQCSKTSAAFALRAGLSEHGKGPACTMRVTRAKPRWALTEDEAAHKEEQEEEELLKFAEELDFDEFVHGMDDAELEAAIQVRFQRHQLPTHVPRPCAGLHTAAIQSDMCHDGLASGEHLNYTRRADPTSHVHCFCSAQKSCHLDLVSEH